MNKYYSNTLKHKSKFYNLLDLDDKTRKLIKKYHWANDQTMQGETVYFVKENDENEI